MAGRYAGDGGAGGHDRLLQLEDPSGLYGATGSISVNVSDAPAQLSASFSDGYWGSNSCSIGSQGLSGTMQWSFAGGTGGSGNLEPNNLPGSGHPVYLEFTFAE